jgi:hypothetical protein
VNSVTLSYTLSFEGPTIKHGPVDVEALAGSRDLAREKLVDALKAPGILRKGRSLCFHLQHKYVRAHIHMIYLFYSIFIDVPQPLDPEKTPVSSVVDQVCSRSRWDDYYFLMVHGSKLKGRDAVIYHALQAAGASPTLHLVIFSEHKPRPIDGTDRGPDFGVDDWEDGPYTVIYPYGVTVDDRTPFTRPRPSHILRWFRGLTPQALEGLVEVTGSPPAHYLNHSYISYGNEAVLCTDYGSICIIANVPGEDVNAPWGPLAEILMEVRLNARLPQIIRSTPFIHT